MLGEILDRNTKLIKFSINLPDITPDFCRQIQALSKKHKGKTPMEANILDTAHGLTLTMKTRDLLVSPRAMLTELQNIPSIFDIKPVSAQY